MRTGEAHTVLNPHVSQNAENFLTEELLALDLASFI